MPGPGSPRQPLSMNDLPARNLTCREANESDLPAMADLFLAARDDMLARAGTPMPTPPREMVVAGYRHVLRTGIFRVAEASGRIESIAGAVVRDGLWFLSAFWTRPGLQRRGVGGPLLKQVHEEGRRRGATTFFTFSSPDLPAVAAYLKLGLLPGTQIFTFAGAPLCLPEIPAGHDLLPLTVEGAGSFDREVRGTAREADHRAWAEMGFSGKAVARGGDPVGYYYANRGMAGPAAWLDARDAEAVLSLAFRDAAATASEVRMIVPGENHTAIRFALAHGLRLASVSHLLTSAPFGRLDRYVSSGPALF